MAPFAGSDAGTEDSRPLHPGPALLPFDRPDLATLHASPRKVLAHWHVFPVSYDNRPPDADLWTENLARPVCSSTCNGMQVRERMLPRPVRAGADWFLKDAKADIRRAEGMGLDGFLWNVPFNPAERRWRWWLDYVRAAEELAREGSGFKIAPNFDCAACADRYDDEAQTVLNPHYAGTEDSPNVAFADEVAAMLTGKLADAGLVGSSALLRHGAKYVVGTFAADRAPAAFWVRLKTSLEARGFEPFLLCAFQNHGQSTAYQQACDGWGDFGSIRNDAVAATRPNNDYRVRYEALASVEQEPIVGAIRRGVLRYKNGDNFGSEPEGSRTLRVNWEVAHATTDWVQLSTWNDMGETTGLAPNTLTQFALSDLTAYFIAWYKSPTNEPPVIERDALYYFHRIARAQPTVVENRSSFPWRDEIELVAFLKAPGKLRILTDADLNPPTHEVGAGVQVVRAPLPASGKPRFQLLRADESGREQVVIDLTSAFAIGPMPDPEDLAYRGGGSLRAAYGNRPGRDPAEVCGGTPADPDACAAAEGEPVWSGR